MEDHLHMVKISLDLMLEHRVNPVQQSQHLHIFLFCLVIDHLVLHHLSSTVWVARATMDLRSSLSQLSARL